MSCAAPGDTLALADVCLLGLQYLSIKQLDLFPSLQCLPLVIVEESELNIQIDLNRLLYFNVISDLCLQFLGLLFQDEVVSHLHQVIIEGADEILKQIQN